MQKLVQKKIVLILSVFAIVLMFGIAGMLHHFSAANAENESAVSLLGIDYDNMELKLSSGGNGIVYYSTDRKKWYEAENLAGNELVYDISWISASKATTLYFRGNIKTDTLSVKIPGYNSKFKVTFDKITGEFEFSNTEGAKLIRWRKSTDYTWSYIYADSSKASGTETVNGKTIDIQSIEDFEKEVENFRVKGTKLVFQTAPEAYDSTTGKGSRASKDVTVTISAKKTAPTVKVNVKKMTINTTTKLEWTNTNPFDTSKTSVWTDCTKSNMSLSSFAQNALDGTGDVTLYFRTAATTSACESKVTALKIPAREKSVKSTVDVTYTPGKREGNGKVTLKFSNLPSQGCEYVVVKPADKDSYDEATASWKTLKTSKEVSFSEKALPTGSVIYIRDAGVAENVNKGVALVLPSMTTQKDVTYISTTSDAASTKTSSTKK